QTVGSEALGLCPPRGLVIDFLGRISGGVETLRSGGLGASLHGGAGATDQLVLDLRAGQRAGDEAADQQSNSRDQQWILLDGLENRLAGLAGDVGSLVAGGLRSL